MVLHNQVVSLELPVNVAVGLHLREGVAAERGRRAQTSHVSVSVRDVMVSMIHAALVAPYLNMAMSRLMSRMLVTSR